MTFHMRQDSDIPHGTIIWRMYYNCRRNKQRFRSFGHQTEMRSLARPGRPISSDVYHNSFHQHLFAASSKIPNSMGMITRRDLSIVPDRLSDFPAPFLSSSKTAGLPSGKRACQAHAFSGLDPNRN